jgi:hypothetical protein
VSPGEKVFSVVVPLLLTVWFAWKSGAALRTGRASYGARLVSRETEPGKFRQWTIAFVAGLVAALGLAAYNLYAALNG